MLLGVHHGSDDAPGFGSIEHPNQVVDHPAELGRVLAFAPAFGNVDGVELSLVGHPVGPFPPHAGQPITERAETRSWQAAQWASR